MKVLIVYDSKFGNTEKVAKAMGEAIRDSSEVSVLSVNECSGSALDKVNLLVVGSPTWAGKPTPTLRKWMQQLPSKSLSNVHVAGFDTRGDFSTLTSKWLIKLIQWFGVAADKILPILIKKGGTPASSPQGFVVINQEGPLKEGELERAQACAREWVIKATQS